MCSFSSGTVRRSPPRPNNCCNTRKARSRTRQRCPPKRRLLPLSAVVGAVFLVWTDALTRVLFAPLEVPVGVFTALLGVPLFLLVLRRRGEL